VRKLVDLTRGGRNDGSYNRVHGGREGREAWLQEQVSGCFMTDTIRRMWFLFVLAPAFVVAACATGLRAADCNGNGVLDSAEIAEDLSLDCNEDLRLDVCDVASVRFGVRPGSLVGGTPLAVRVADLNNDGIFDVAAAHSEGGTVFVSVFFNRGAREFESATLPLTSGTSLVSFTIGDLDNDGNGDLVGLTAAALAIVLGRGDETFEVAREISMTVGSSGFAAGDLNGDDLPELLVTERTRDAALVFHSRGAGVWGEPVEVTVGDSPRAPVLADLNGDGHLDLAVANRRSDDISIALGAGDGTLVPEAESLALPAEHQNPRGLLAADLNGNGRLDLVAATPSALVFYANASGGAFDAPVPFVLAEANTTSEAFAVVDADGDGDLDIATHSKDPFALTFVLNRGDGVLDRSFRIERPDAPRSIGVGDLNQDGQDDLVMILQSATGFELLRSGEENRLTLAPSLDLDVVHKPHTMNLADIDSDGDLDALVGTDASLNTFVNDGTGTLAERAVVPSAQLWSLITADFDRDGDLDVAAAGLGSVFVIMFYSEGFSEGGEPAYRQKNYRVGQSPNAVASADLDGDGLSEFFTANSASRDVSILHNRGGEEFVKEDLSFPGPPRDVEPLDVDHDGDVDVVVAVGDVVALLNDGAGGFLERATFSSQGVYDVVPRDFDGDGWEDIVTLGADGVSMLRGLGRGRFADPVSVDPTGQFFAARAVDDLDGNGFPDVVAGDPGGAGSIAIYLNNGRSGFEPALRFRSGNETRFVAAGDLDGDGDPDVVAMSRSSQQLHVFFNESQGAAVRFLTQICTEAEFYAISIASSRGPPVERLTKYIVPVDAVDPDVLAPHFQNVQLFPLHQDFLVEEFPDEFPGLTIELYDQLVNRRAARRYFVGDVFLLSGDDGPRYGFNILTDPREPPTQEEVSSVYRTLLDVVALGPLGYFPDSRATREEAAAWLDAEFPIFLDEILEPEFAAYTQAVGFGTLRILSQAEFNEANDNGLLSFRDVLVLDFSPRDIEAVVGGVLTGEVQGDLSHVVIRTARRGTPNAFVQDAAEKFASFAGKLVRLEVTADGVDMRDANIKEAEEHWASSRPSISVLPEIDPDFSELLSLPEIAAMDAAFDPEGGDFPSVARFGGKATNLARLYDVLDGPFEEYRERGFAIPVRYYLEFVRSNRMPSAIEPGRLVTYEEYVFELLEHDEFASNSEFRFQALDDLRDHMRDEGVVDPDLIARVAARVDEIFETPATTRVRFRSSSNAEDALEFNGAGLYDSTSGCRADQFDGDDVGPSLCDSTKENERTIARALKRVWRSLWNFRAFEERAFFGIPQQDVVMAVLCNRTFTDEVINGVAFTGNPANALDRRYVVTAQVGEASVVSPEPGVVAEKNVLDIVGGEVLGITRSLPSSLVDPGALVVSQGQLEELGAVLWHVDQRFPLELGNIPREQVILDFEFKFMPDGELAVKQVRPFLLSGEIPPAPTFELEIPTGTEVCAGFLGRDNFGISLKPADWHRSKSTVRFVGGVHELPTVTETFDAELFEEVQFGPDRETLTPAGPGTFQVRRIPSDGTTTYDFDYAQTFLLASGETFELELFDLRLRAQGDEPLDRILFDEEYLTRTLALEGFQSIANGHCSCTNELLPLWEIRVELDDGSSFQLLERFEDPPDEALTGPASLTRADVTLRGERRVVEDYWDLIYASQRHNTGLEYWVLFDPPLVLAPLDENGVGRPVRVLEFVHPQTEPFPIAAAVSYLDENLEVIVSPGVVSFQRTRGVPEPVPVFRRGDVNGDGRSNIVDAIRILDFVFGRGEAIGCRSAADANDDGRVNIVDAIRVAHFLFGGDLPPPPFAKCGPDPTADSLTCESADACGSAD
jgi:hypothetical protein